MSSTPQDDRHPQLVFGDDGSAAADTVWQWVDNHQWPGWRISVLTARMPEVGPPVGPERATPHPWDPPHPRALQHGKDVLVEHLLAESDPRVALDSFTDAALVAVGPRGKGLFKQLLIGSTVEWLASAPPPQAPVVVVRSPETTRQVLLCVDDSQHARSAVDALTAFPWIEECAVHVLGVDDARNKTGDAVEGAADALEHHGVRQVESEVIDALEQTADFDVRTAVLDTIAQRSPDLVAVGARGTGGLRGLLLGSVATAVVRRAPCSVLIAKTLMPRS